MNKLNSSPTQFNRVGGRYNSLAPFFIASGDQESISTGNYISLNCFNSKLYTTDASVSLSLSNGVQDGQLKKFTLVFKGNDETCVTIHCPSLQGVSSQVTFSNVGDQLLMMWNGGAWCVLETLNIMDPSFQTPVVE